jgi:hypothetical protein
MYSQDKVATTTIHTILSGRGAQMIRLRRRLNTELLLCCIVWGGMYFFVEAIGNCGFLAHIFPQGYYAMPQVMTDLVRFLEFIPWEPWWVICPQKILV